MPLTLEYKDLLVELKFIGKIPKGMVIDTYYHTFQDPNSWIVWFKRTFSTESRAKTTAWLQDILNIADKKLMNLKESEQKTLLKILAQSKIGYINVSETYKDKGDIYLGCKLETMAVEVDEILERHNYTIPVKQVKKKNKQVMPAQQTPQTGSSESQYYDD